MGDGDFAAADHGLDRRAGPDDGAVARRSAVNLAVSLHATTNELRDRLAPINQRYPLEALIEACRDLPIKRARRAITFEYVMLGGVNDSPADARRLVRLLAPLRAKVNLIFFNPFPGAPFEASPRAPRSRAFKRSSGRVT